MFGLKNKFIAYINKTIADQKNANTICSSGNINPSTVITASVLHGNISVGEGTRIDQCVIAGKEISIGNYTSINGPNTAIYAEINKVTIGNYCSIARNVDIQEWNHPIKKLSTSLIKRRVLGESMIYEIESKGAISIGHDVWIGAQSVILSGANIGNGAIIGANSVVSGNIPPFAIAVGTPAKVIKYRFEPAIIEKISQIEWWHWDTEKLKANMDLFDNPITSKFIPVIT